MVESRDNSNGTRLGWTILGLTLLGAGLRAIHLDSTIGFDEAVNVRRFIQGGPPSILALHSGYGSTNNHVLNSLLAYASVRAFGLEVWALRLPSFLFAVLTLPLVGVLTMRLARDRIAAGIATLLVALSPILVGYSAACRGYGALLFFALCSALFLLRGLEGGRAALPLLSLALLGVGWSHMSGLVFVGTCGLCTLWICLHAASPRSRRARPGSLQSALLTLLAVTVAALGLVAWYSRGAHILSDVGNRIVRGEFIDPSLAGLRSVADSGFVPWIALVGKEFFGTPVHWLLVSLPLAFVGIWSLWSRAPRASGILAALIVIPPLALLAGRLMPTPRYFLFVQPFLLVASAYGLARLARLARAPLFPAILLGAGFSALSLPLLRRDLTGPGASLMGIAWDIESAVDFVADHAEPGDLVLSFPRQKERGPWREWAFWQSFQFHADLRLATLLDRTTQDADTRATYRIWYVTPGREASESYLFPPGYEPERVAEYKGCTVFVDELDTPALRPPIPQPFDLHDGDLVGWTWYDPFAGATLRTAPAVSIRADRSGAVGEIRSPQWAVTPGTRVQIDVQASAVQSSGLRPFARLAANFYDARGERVAGTARTAAPWKERRPESTPFPIRISTVIPLNAAFLEISLGLAEGTHAGDAITFRPPTLRLE